MGSLGMTTWLCSVGSTMLNSRKTLFFKISFSLPERVGWRLFRCPRAGSVHVGQLRSGWAGSDPVALTAPLLPRETQTQQCLLREWVFAWRLSLINPSWKVIWLNVLFVSFFRFFFLNQFSIFPEILWRWRFCNPQSLFWAVLILTCYNTLSISG